MDSYTTESLTNSHNSDIFSKRNFSGIPSNIQATSISSIIIDYKEDDSKSFENSINDNRLSLLERNFTNKFISYILEDDFEYGVEYKAHILVKEQIKINASATKEWLNKIYVNNFGRSDVLIGILRVVSRFSREEISSIGDTIALASLSHKNVIVQENGIRAFESWGGQQSITILENIDDEILKRIANAAPWVKEYLDGVIEDLKLEYAN